MENSNVEPLSVVISSSDDGDMWEEDKSKKLFHPKQFQPVKKVSKKKKSTKSTGRKAGNPYSKSAYQYEFSSSDSDFV